MTGRRAKRASSCRKSLRRKPQTLFLRRGRRRRRIPPATTAKVVARPARAGFAVLHAGEIAAIASAPAAPPSSRKRNCKSLQKAARKELVAHGGGGVDTLTCVGAKGPQDGIERTVT